VLTRSKIKKFRLETVRPTISSPAEGVTCTSAPIGSPQTMGPVSDRNVVTLIAQADNGQGAMAIVAKPDAQQLLDDAALGSLISASGDAFKSALAGGEVAEDEPMSQDHDVARVLAATDVNPSAAFEALFAGLFVGDTTGGVGLWIDAALGMGMINKAAPQEGKQPAR
jgi:hypothetical protein